MQKEHKTELERVEFESLRLRAQLNEAREMDSRDTKSRILNAEADAREARTKAAQALDALQRETCSC